MKKERHQVAHGRGIAVVVFFQANLDLIYDTTFKDVQPYLFKVSHSCADPSGSGVVVGGGATSPSVTTTVRRLLKDTLAI